MSKLPSLEKLEQRDVKSLRKKNQSLLNMMRSPLKELMKSLNAMKMGAVIELCLLFTGVVDN